jgi:molybdate transport repressor ModE-like protein
MNLTNLRVLVHIAEEGSLSAAARAMGLSQPAVTKQVQRMEAELGVPLLARARHGQAEFTPAGERVLAFARETLARLQALEEELALLKEVKRGRLTLAASTIPGEYLLPRLLATFRTEAPQVEVQMTISDTADVVAKVLAGAADLGVIGSRLERPGLRLERFVEDEIVLVVHPAHPFARRQSVTAAELRDQPLVLREEGSGTRRSVERALLAAHASLQKEQVVLTLGSTQAILQAVAQGLGIGFASVRATAQAQAAGLLVGIRLADVDLRRHLYLAYLPQRAGDPAVARFLQFARAQLEVSGPQARLESQAPPSPASSAGSGAQGGSGQNWSSGLK